MELQGRARIVVDRTGMAAMDRNAMDRLGSTRGGSAAGDTQGNVWRVVQRTGSSGVAGNGKQRIGRYGIGSKRADRTVLARKGGEWERRKENGTGSNGLDWPVVERNRQARNGREGQ